MTSTKSLKEIPQETTGSNQFANRLRALRKKAGLTQEELAHRVGVSLMTIRRWEYGERQPRAEEIKRLAEALHVKEQQLLSPEQPSRWVLTVKIAQEFSEEVIDMSKSVPTVSAITTTPTGGYLCLGGNYELWTDNNNFKKFIADLKKFRATVIQNGKALGGIRE